MSPSEILNWDTAQRKTWSIELLTSVVRHKRQLDKVDTKTFATGYNRLDQDRQVKFWGELIIAVSKFESSWNPHEVYHERPHLLIP